MENGLIYDAKSVICDFQALSSKSRILMEKFLFLRDSCFTQHFQERNAMYQREGTFDSYLLFIWLDLDGDRAKL